MEIDTLEFTEGQGQDQYEEKIAFSLQILKAFVMTRDMIIHGEDAVKLRRELHEKWRIRVPVLTSLENLSKYGEYLSVVVTSDPHLFSCMKVKFLLSPDVLKLMLQETDSQKLYILNRGCYIRSLLLSDKRVAVLGRHEVLAQIVRENNGSCVVDAGGVDHLIIDSSDTWDTEELLRYIHVRTENPNCRIFERDKYENGIKTRLDIVVLESLKAELNIFSFLSFFAENLDPDVSQHIEFHGGRSTYPYNICVIGGKTIPIKDYMMITRQLRGNVVFVDQKWIVECVETLALVNIEAFILPTPELPPFHTQPIKECKFYIHRSKSEEMQCSSFLTEVEDILKSLGACVTDNAEDAVGFIAEPFNVCHQEGYTRNVYCMKDLATLGVHECCPYYHYVFDLSSHYAISSLSKINIRDILGKGTSSEVLFLRKLADSVPPNDTVPQDVVVLIVNDITPKVMKHIREYDYDSATLITSQFFADLFEKRQFTDFNLYQYSVDLTAQSLSHSHESDSHSNDGVEEMDVGESSEVFSYKSCLWSIRKMTALWMFDKLLSGNLNLDISPVKTLHVQWVPKFITTESIELTYDAMIQVLGTGCIIDLSNDIASSQNSPFVGGVFAAKNIVTLEEWLERLLAYFHKLYTELGFVNIFREETYNGTNLGISFRGQIYRLLVAEVGHHAYLSIGPDEYPAIKFGVPSIVINLIGRMNYIPPSVATHHVIILCPNDDCEGRCKHIFHFQRNLRAAYFTRISDVPVVFTQNSVICFQILDTKSGLVYAKGLDERNAKLIQFAGDSDLENQLLDFMTEVLAQNNITGDRMFYCQSCAPGEDCEISTIGGWTFKCKNCEKSNLTAGFLANIVETQPENVRTSYSDQSRDDENDDTKNKGPQESPFGTKSSSENEDNGNAHAGDMCSTEDPSDDKLTEYIKPISSPYLRRSMLKKIFANLESDPSTVILKISPFAFTQKDLRLLFDRKEMLLDVHVDIYLSLIMKRNGKFSNLPTVFTFPAYHFPILVNRKLGYKVVEDFLDKSNIFERDLILIPAHKAAHWRLVVFDTRSVELRCYDSNYSSCTGTDNILDDILRYLVTEHRKIVRSRLTEQDNFEVEEIEKRSNEETKKYFEGISRTFVRDLPQQNNGIDCGVFMLQFAEYLSRDSVFDFTSEHMGYFRLKMCYEIIDGELMTTS